VDSSWADVPDRYSTHAGCEFVGSHLIESWVATDQVRALSTAEAELYGIVDGSARGIMTRTLHEELGVVWPIEVGSDSSAAISISSKAGVGKTRHIELRWLWVQDAVRTKLVKLKKIDGATNVSDMGTKPLEPKRHQELMKQLPLAPPRCRRFLAVLAAMVAAEAAEATEVALMKSDEVCRRQEASDVGIFEQFKMYSSYVIVIMMTIVFIRVYDKIKLMFTKPVAEPPRQEPETQQRRAPSSVSVASQSQCTYTSVRGVAQPRFQVLPEYSQG